MSVKIPTSSADSVHTPEWAPDHSESLFTLPQPLQDHKVELHLQVATQRRTMRVVATSLEEPNVSPTTTRFSASNRTDLCLRFNLLLLDHFLHHALRQRQEHGLGQLLVFR